MPCHVHGKMEHGAEAQLHMHTCLGVEGCAVRLGLQIVAGEDQQLQGIGCDIAALAEFNFDVLEAEASDLNAATRADGLAQDECCHVCIALLNELSGTYAKPVQVKSLLPVSQVSLELQGPAIKPNISQGTSHVESVYDAFEVH